MPGNPWWDFLDTQLRDRGWSPAELARLSGVSQSRIVDWRDAGAVPSIKNVRAVAGALDLPLLVVLVAAGILSPSEANLPSLDAYSTLELLRELESRVEGQRSRHTLVGRRASSGTADAQHGQPDPVFTEVEQMIKQKEAARPRRRALRAVTGQGDEHAIRDGESTDDVDG